MTTAACVRPSRIPSRVERAAEQPETAEGRDEPDAGDRGRQDERQLDEHDRERAAGKAARREEVCGRRAEEEDERLRDRARLQAEDERVGHDRLRELRDELPGRDSGEDRDDGEEQEAERDGRSREHGGAGNRAADQCGIRRKPAARSFFCAGLLRSRRIHAFAACRCLLDLTAAAA